MDGIIIEAGNVFPPPCLSWWQVWLGLEEFKAFVVSDHCKLSTQKFILPFHESFQDCKCLVFMCTVNFFDRNPAGRHVSQFAPCPYIALISIQVLSVMTHTGSFLLKSTGFNIGNCLAIALMLWKHLSSNGVHWKVWLFCANPDNRVVYAVMSGMYSTRVLY